MKTIAEQLKVFLKPEHIIYLAMGLMTATWLSPVSAAQTLHKTIDIDGVEIFYREAGPVDAPTILLLHGFPTSSHMFRNLIPALSDQYHVIAPDYPGFGNSAQPLMSDFDYSFDNIALVMEHFISTLEIKNYSLYLMDYGAPIGFRLASKHPEKVDSLIIQNGNAYSEETNKPSALTTGTQTCDISHVRATHLFNWSYFTTIKTMFPTTRNGRHIFVNINLQR